MAKNKKTDIERYKENYISEQEGIYLYQNIAAIEKNTHIKDLFNKIAEIEKKHSNLWVKHLKEAKVELPIYKPNWRVKTLLFMARSFGTNLIIPIIASMENNAMDVYDQQPEAIKAGLPKDERSHSRLFTQLQKSVKGGVPGSTIAQIEGRHRNTGGNQLRAAVLGASDGLTSNLSLVMGIAGFSSQNSTVLATGFAGLLAGALSMAIGEYLSVSSARELFTHQIEIEKQEIREVPDEEAEELSLIYQAKGLDLKTSNYIAESLIKQEAMALDTMAREELGIDPEELGGSPWTAAFTSFFLFSLGAIVPVIPFIFTSGMNAVIMSLILGSIGFFIVGVGVSLTTGISLIKSGTQQVVLGLLAAATTFGLGKLVGKAIS